MCSRNASPCSTTEVRRVTLRIASVAWKIRHVRSDGEYFGHLYDLVNSAHKAGAQMVVLPELTSLELLPLAPDLEEKDVPAFLAQFAQGIEEWLLRISASSGMVLVGGAHFRQVGDRFVNACVTATPDGELSITQKNRLTGYERDYWHLAPGDGLARLPDPRFGVLVCYDCAFPEAGAALAATGVQAVLVPAFTKSAEGFERVRSACHACATGNLMFGIHASLVGSGGNSVIAHSYGSTAIIAPSVGPFLSDPVLCETDPNEEGLAIADLDFEALQTLRTEFSASTGEQDGSSEWAVR